MDYKSAGVDVEAGYRAVELMKAHVQKTLRPEVMGGLGGFSGAFSMKGFAGMEHPVLLSGTDGVGTKLKLAFLMDRHDTVGIDCVAMCVNDVACAGGEPLFFLDYVACGKNVPEKIAAIVGGVAQGCVQAGAALIGGETAEMPGFYPEDEYDLAGFAVGIADEKDIITGKDIAPGDVLVGIASSGVHSNGFSLVRKILGGAGFGGRVGGMQAACAADAESKAAVAKPGPASGGATGADDPGADCDAQSRLGKALGIYEPRLGQTWGEALLAPTKIYVKALGAVKGAGVRVKGCAHITGGGFYENIPRMLPEGIHANIRKDSYPVPALFPLLASHGDVAETMMYNTFNMGIGMVLALSPRDADAAMSAICLAGEKAYVIGEAMSGHRGVTVA
ncbi:MAG: phosphoribosylformylglycinamidine cyclo-ligase [Lachnospiraceae bacterium]|jgi:phosphoribosylformylglycinamidine cyclo-ligase|nr:phosphoribosylformylglycinamidine cyclo-ligase [Lachnospiraceae bacterium]